MVRSRQRFPSNSPPPPPGNCVLQHISLCFPFVSLHRVPSRLLQRVLSWHVPLLSRAIKESHSTFHLEKHRHHFHLGIIIPKSISRRLLLLLTHKTFCGLMSKCALPWLCSPPQVTR